MYVLRKTANLYHPNFIAILCMKLLYIIIVKALKIEHIGYIAIRKYNTDGSTVYLENNTLLSEDLRFIKIELR